MHPPFNEPRLFAILLPGGRSGEVAPANPPFVNWFPAEGAHRYRVTLEGRGQGGAWETLSNFFTPAAALEPGAWTVIVEALDAAGKILARDERQTMLGQPIGESFGDLNRLRKDPSARLFLSDADVASILRADGERGAWRDALLASADRVDETLLAGPCEPDPYPETGWEFETWKRNNSVCIALEDAIVAAASAWRLTGDEKYREPALRLLAHTAKWDPLGTTSVWENDHSDHALLHAFSVAYDTFREHLPEDLRAALRRSIAARCRDIFAFLNPFHMKELSCGLMGSPANNHAWFVAEAMGLGGLALWDEEPDAPQWVALATQLHTGAFFPYGDSDGGWHEGIDYWSYSLLFTFEFADALRDTTGVDLYRHPWLRKTTSWKLLTHPPAGAYVPFGDVKHHPALAVDRLIAMRLASAHADPLEWRYVDALADRPIQDRRYLPHALAWSDRGIITPEAAAQAEPPKAVHYRDMGWLVANSDPFREDSQVLFAFRSGDKHPDANSHSHADLNSFILCVAGEKLLWDAGYYDSYGSPHHLHSARPTKAHNAILVDGAGQVLQTRGTTARITRCEIRGTDVDLESDASSPLVSGGAWDKWLRRATLQGLKELAVEDVIETPFPARISLLLHSVYPILWDPGEKTLRIRGEQFELLGRLETDQPMDAILTTTFEHPCNVRSALLDTADEYPDQYHLELRTAKPIRTWTPRLRFTWHPAADTA